jgi:hypothetical protein
MVKYRARPFRALCAGAFGCGLGSSQREPEGRSGSRGDVAQILLLVNRYEFNAFARLAHVLEVDLDDGARDSFVWWMPAVLADDLAHKRDHLTA